MLRVCAMLLLTLPPLLRHFTLFITPDAAASPPLRGCRRRRHDCHFRQRAIAMMPAMASVAADFQPPLSFTPFSFAAPPQSAQFSDAPCLLTRAPARSAEC
jgi:hypothetical protein